MQLHWTCNRRLLSILFCGKSMALVLSSKDAKRFIQLMAEVKKDQKIKQQADRGRIILASINKLKEGDKNGTTN